MKKGEGEPLLETCSLALTTNTTISITAQPKATRQSERLFKNGIIVLSTIVIEIKLWNGYSTVVTVAKVQIIIF